MVIRLVVALGGHEPLPMDVWWHELMLATLSDVGILIAWIPAHVGGTIGMIVIGILIVAAFLWRKRPWDAAHVAIAMVIVVAIGAPMSYIVARTRPEGSLAESTATSFPSGHTAVATTVAITLALIFRRWYVWVLGAGWVVLMMWSRTYLQAHWLSDVHRRAARGHRGGVSRVVRDRGGARPACAAQGGGIGRPSASPAAAAS